MSADAALSNSLFAGLGKKQNQELKSSVVGS